MVELSSKFARLASKVLPHNNSWTVAPPGIVRQGEGTPIIVSSLMRTGTHLTIDLILNNFFAYRNSPLYINLDLYLTEKLPIDRLFSCGTYILKTHFPQYEHDSSALRVLKELAGRSYVIQPKRSIDSVYRSLCKFSSSADYDTLIRESERFHDFWRQYQPYEVNFNDLISKEKGPSVIRGIGDHINQKARRCHVLSPPSGSFRYVYLLKILTRLFGKYSPVINTTIQFSRS